MKIKFIRDDIQVSKGVEFDNDRMKEVDGCYFMRSGVEVECDDRTAWIHVGNADAVPADDEAKKLCANRMKNWAYKVKARDALGKGIHPDDMDDFMDGKILGYNENGSVIPAPGWEIDEEEDDEE